MKNNNKIINLICKDRDDTNIIKIENIEIDIPPEITLIKNEKLYTTVFRIYFLSLLSPNEKKHLLSFVELQSKKNTFDTETESVLNTLKKLKIIV